MKSGLFRLMAVALMAAVTLASCSPAGDEGAFIPRNASFVCHIDVASLWKKGGLDNAGDLQMVKNLHQELQSSNNETDKMLDAILKDPDACGLDFRQPVCIFSTILSPDHWWMAYEVTSAKMGSRSKFDQIVANLEKACGEDFKRCDTLGTTAFHLTDNILVAYNDDRFFLMHCPYDNLVDESEPFKGIPDGKQYLAKLLSLKKEESMAGYKYFSRYLADRKDLSYFMNYGGTLDTRNSTYSMLALFYGEETLKQLAQASMSITGTFEKGCIRFATNTYGAPEVLTKFVRHDFDGKLLGYLPAHTLAAFTLGLDLKAVTEYLDGMEGVDLDEPIGIKDYTLKDLLGLLGGNMAASFYGFQQGTPLFAAVIDLNDNEMARDLLDELGGCEHDERVYILDELPMIDVFLGDKVAVITTDLDVIATAQAGGKSNGLMAVADKAKEGNFFYLDLKPEDWPTELLSSIGFLDNPILVSVFGMLDHLELASAHNSTECTGALYLSNSEENSLAYILREIDKLM